MDEIKSRELEDAWSGLVLKLQQFHAQLPPLEASLCEAIVHAAAEDAVGAEAPDHARIPANGMLWRGQPAFFTQGLLEELQAEAAQARGHAIQLKSRSLAWAGRVATQLITSAPLIEFVRTHAGNCESTGRTAYV